MCQPVAATPERTASPWTPHQDSGGLEFKIRPAKFLILSDLKIQTSNWSYLLILTSDWLTCVTPASRVSSALVTPRYCHVSWDRGQVRPVSVLYCVSDCFKLCNWSARSNNNNRHQKLYIYRLNSDNPIIFGSDREPKKC